MALSDPRPTEEPRALRLRSAQDIVLLRVNGPTVIGRKECDIVVKHPSVSSRHASIELLPSGPAQDSFESSLKVALLTDLSSTNGTFAGALPAGTRVPPEGARLSIGDYMRFGFCPWIYRLEVVPSTESAESTEWEQAGTSSRDERRQQQLKFAETSYLGWLTQVREEYAAVRSRAEAAGSPMAYSPSLEQLEATCTAFLQRPVSRCASASSPFSRTWASKLPSPSGKNRPATSMAQLAMKECDHCQVEDTLEGVEPCLADIEAEVERLAGRSWEVSSILRPSLASAADLENVECQIQEALHFVTDSLPRLASDVDQQVCGPTFQALLVRGRPAPGHAARERTSSDLLNGLGDEVGALVLSAEQLIGLLRVKIEDDADLALARTVLEDTSRFFWDLDQCAKWRRVTTWELFEEVND